MQQQHPIDNMMQTTMESIRGMVDVNTVVGAPVMDQKGTTIIPISKVSFGFVAGGGEYAVEDGKQKPVPTDIFPFAGGTGAGVSVQPVGFLVVTDKQVKMLPAVIVLRHGFFSLSRAFGAWYGFIIALFVRREKKACVQSN